MNKKQRWKLSLKEKKEIFDRSARIFYAFDGIEDQGCKNNEAKAESSIETVILQVAQKEFDELHRMIGGKEDGIWNFFQPVCFSAFAMGYVFGQMFDLPYPGLLMDVEALKEKAREKCCFAYLPRQR